MHVNSAKVRSTYWELVPKTLAKRGRQMPSSYKISFQIKAGAPLSKTLQVYKAEKRS